MNVNNEVTLNLSQDEKELLIKVIKLCKQIASNCNCNTDMFMDADIVFAEIYEAYFNDSLPSVIHLYE